MINFDITNIENFLTTGNIDTRNTMLSVLTGLSNLGLYWDPSYMAVGSEITPNAFIYGLIINDWDKSFQSRSANITTDQLLIPFQYLNKIPEISKGANYQQVSDVIGRFEDISIYANSTVRDFQLELIYQAEARTDSELKTFWTLEELERIEKRLMAMVYPLYTNQFGPPPKLLLNIGNIYRSVPMIITKVTSPPEPPFDYFTGLPMMRHITLECKTSYPMWQALSGDKIFIQPYGNGVFAYEQLTPDYTSVPKGQQGT